MTDTVPTCGVCGEPMEWPHGLNTVRGTKPNVVELHVRCARIWDARKARERAEVNGDSGGDVRPAEPAQPAHGGAQQAQLARPQGADLLSGLAPADRGSVRRGGSGGSSLHAAMIAQRPLGGDRNGTGENR